MVVALSFVLYNWSIEQATLRSEEIESRADPLVCSEVGISIDGSCQTFRSLEINVSNTKNTKIVGVQIRMVGLYPEDPDYLYSATVMQEVKNGDTEHLSVLKKGTLSQIQVIPIALKNDKNIYCEEKSVTKEQKDLKQC